MSYKSSVERLLSLKISLENVCMIVNKVPGGISLVASKV